MKGEQFAKIFETENGQVLVRKDFDIEEDKFKLICGMDINGLYADVKFTSKATNKDEAEIKLQEMFNKCDLDMASKVSNMIIQQVSNLT